MTTPLEIPEGYTKDDWVIKFSIFTGLKIEDATEQDAKLVLIAPKMADEIKRLREIISDSCEETRILREESARLRTVLGQLRGFATYESKYDSLAEICVLIDKTLSEP